MKRKPSVHRERGAAAVEFALVLPLLITLVLGIIEFGHLYNAQIVITNAAREAARTMAITNNSGTAASAAQAVATGYTINVTVGACTSGAEVVANVTSGVGLLTGSWLGMPSTITVNGQGAMRCGG
ncbi:pilus assembly protein [Sinomonas notoginsengisoli]